MIKNPLVAIFQRFETLVHRFSTITILLLICSGSLIVIELSKEENDELSINFPSDPFIGKVYQQTIIVGKGQRFDLIASSRFNTQMTIISGYFHSQWLKNQTTDIAIYNKIGTSFNSSITVSNFTILYLYWNNSLIENDEIQNILIFKGSITGVDQDSTTVILLLIVITIISEAFNQIKLQFRKLKEKTNIITPRNGNQFKLLIVTKQQGEQEKFKKKNELHYLFRRELSTLPKSILFGICIITLWIIKPLSSFELVRPSPYLLSLNLLTLWNSLYENMVILWIGFLLLVGGFYWRSRIEIKELRSYFTLAIHRKDFALIVFILISLVILLGLSIPYLATLLINYLRFGIFPDYIIFLSHIIMIFTWLMILFLCGSVGFLLLRQLPVFSVVTFLFGSLFIFYSLIVKFVPNFASLLPTITQNMFIYQNLDNPIYLSVELMVLSGIDILILIVFTVVYVFVITHLQTEDVANFQIPNFLMDKIKKQKIGKKGFRIKKRIQYISKINFSTITICLLVFFGLSVSQIFLESISPTQGYLPKPHSINTNTQSKILSNIVIAPGQSISINISTTHSTTLKIIPIIYGVEINISNFTGYTSNNTLYHFLNIPPAKEYTVYNVYIANFSNESVIYSGKVLIRGFNHLYLLIPIILILMLIIWTLLRKIHQALNRGEKNILININGRTIFSPSFLTRIRLLWCKQIIVFNNKRIAITAFLIWVIMQPLNTISPALHLTNSSSHYSLLISAFDTIFLPVFLCLFLLMLFITIDSASVIAEKRSNHSIRAFFSLPIKRVEWVLINFSWQLFFYGGLLSFIILIKILLLNFQLKYYFPVIPLIFIFIFILTSLSVWISIGLIFSIQSYSIISTVTKTMISILIFTIITYTTVSSWLYNGLSPCGGVLGIVEMPRVMWGVPFDYIARLKDIKVEGLLVTTTPYMEPFLNSILQTSICFIIVFFIMIIQIRKFEIE